MPTRTTIWRWLTKKCREPRKALKHWQSYVKLDTSGPWSVHARSQIKRILQADGLKLVHGAKQGVSFLGLFHLCVRAIRAANAARCPSVICFQSLAALPESSRC